MKTKKSFESIICTLILLIMTLFVASAIDCSHTSAELITRQENIVESTYTKAGSYENVTYCGACGTELNRSAAVTDKKTLPAVKNITTEAIAPDVIKVGWDFVEEAEGYIVYLFNPKTEKFEEAATVTGGSVAESGVTDIYKTTDNKFMVKAYVYENGKRILSPDSKTAVEYVRPATPEKLTYTATTSEITIKWRESEGAVGYRIYKYNWSKNKYSELATIQSNKYTVKVDAPGTGLRVKVKAYKKANGKTLWSDETEPLDACSAPLPAKNIKYDVSASGIKLMWNCDRVVEGYRIYQYNSKTKKWVKLTTTELGMYTGNCDYTISGLEGGTYKFRIDVFIKSGGKTVWSEPVETPEIKAAPEAVKQFSVSSSAATSLTLSWSKAKGADGYGIYLYDNTKKKWKKIKSTSSLKDTVKDLEPGSMHEFTIKAYRKINGKTVWSNSSYSIAGYTKLSDVSGFKASQSDSAITLKWKKVKGADGYIIYKYNSKTKEYEKIKTVKSDSSLSYKISKNLKSGTTYKFRIKAYSKAGKKTILSDATDLTTATEPKKVSLSSLKSASKKKMTVSWKSVTGANGYQVVYSTSKSFDKKSDITLEGKKSTKATIKKLRSGKKYYVKVRAYRTVNSKKIYGKYSAVQTVKIK